MRKTHLRSTLASLLLALALPVAAQDNGAGQRVSQKLSKLTPSEQKQLRDDFRKSHPLAVGAMIKHDAPHDFVSASRTTLKPRATASTARRAPLRLSAGTTLWGNLAYDSDWSSSYYPYGYYSFHPTQPVSFTLLSSSTQSQEVANHGVGYTDGHLYCIYADLSYAAYGWVDEYLNDINTDTWTMTTKSLSDYSLIALETAQAADGTVYGEFYNADFTALEYGTIDYTTLTRTTFGTSSRKMVALGVTNDDRLYGVATDGNLYRIDTTTGTETLVGATGLTVANSSGGYYSQTGEIDTRDNTFYWMALESDGTGGLYTVDLSTGAATLVSESEAQVLGMVVPIPAAEDGAPAKATDVKAAFSGESLTGTVSFTAPSTTYGGATLSGQLSYTIYESNLPVVSGTTTAGAATTATVTVAEGGQHKFVVTTSNAAGESPKASATAWAGLDTPQAVSNLTVSVDDAGLATVSWTAPTTGTHGGSIGTVSYDVYRNDGSTSTTVAMGISATTFTDQLSTAEMAMYRYTVYARNAQYTSAGRTSDGKLVGEAVYPDWREDFLDSSNLGFFTILDANSDGETWVYGSNQGDVTSSYSNDNGNDDWLVTPPVHLTPGRIYNFSFRAMNDLPDYPNTLEVCMGREATADAMTQTLFETFTPEGSYVNYEKEITVSEEGNYFFGFHDNTEEAGQYRVVLDNVYVLKGGLTTSPDSVTSLSVLPAAQGALAATVSLKAPALNVSGQTLARMDSITLQRDGVTVHVFPQPRPGASLSFSDTGVDASGTHTYTAQAWLDGEGGREASASAYIGIDTPAAPENVVLKDNTSSVLVSWDAASTVGAQGGYVNPADVSLSLYERKYSSWYGYRPGDKVADSEKGATSLTLDIDPEASVNTYGTQDLLQYFATATNAEGSSANATTRPLVVGPTLTLPFRESMAGGNVENGLAWTETNAQASRDDAAPWQMNTSSSSDADGGSAVWQPFYYYYQDYTILAGDEYSFNMPKVSLAGASKPVLAFSLYAKAAEQASLTVKAQRPDGAETSLATFDLSQRTADGWQTEQVDLSSLKQERYVIVKFVGHADSEDTYIGIDDVNMLDQKANDLEAVSLTTPAKATAGTSAKATVKLRNIGAGVAMGFSVVLMAGDEAVDSVKVTEPLGVLGSLTVNLSLPVKITAKDDLSVWAKIVWADDLFNDNNSTEANTVSVEQPTSQTVDDLTGATRQDDVVLTWSEPTEPETETVTETFESYDDFVTTFGDWTCVAASPTDVAGQFLQNYTYPVQGKAFAFAVFNPSTMYSTSSFLTSNPGFTPHGGEKYAATPFKYNPTTYEFAAGDNWLISPSLSGREQTISFYALNFASSGTVSTETFDLLSSSTTTDTIAFTKIGETLKADGAVDNSDGPNWKRFEVTLPEGAKYFAIHQNTCADSTFIFAIDDVTYETSYVNRDGDIVGYNVYCDGELIGSVDASTTTFTATGGNDPTGHVYNVTVVYEDAEGNRHESAFSNDAAIGATSISDLENRLGAQSYDVYTVGGRALMIGAQSLNGLQRGIYVINGRTCVVK